MGRRGPKPESAEEALARGTYSNARHALRNPPKPSGKLVKPADMSPLASALWDKLAPQLEESGIATNWDSETFEMTCSWYATWKTTADAARQVEGKDRERLLQQAMKASTMWQKFASKFGLTPADRQNINVEKPEDKSDKMRLLG